MSYQNPSSITDSACYVQAGETIITNKTDILVSTPLGSCVAVVAYDPETKTGGMAHVMLPGKAPDNYHPDDKNKYCHNAIEYLLKKLSNFGLPPEKLEICLAGGANVLKKPNDTIARAMVSSVLHFIAKKNLNIIAAVLGGMERRTISLDTTTGIVSYTCGDNAPKVLWQYLHPKQ
ncbi:chemotaxis protein CheD [Candidatus Sulfidibacterium hydrothermale]|uniref:chemotaxis protein CheD n=1 Tax=Candidatus Sulfidibacterium hydrothermale TaxID=2875962 RepID=UPI001F0A3BED|nr:chemotaxis protein CheD [Candidatus Sulfidibacterium hydrothermale]UBM61466.1 chemotaxis protein CheD [Candidatus Sulfidibacterium hydrothermale]